MSWARLDDGFYDHPRVIRAGFEATGLFCLALSYASRHSTDGALESAVLAMLSQGRADLVATLVDVGLFETAESGVSIRNFLAYNPSSREVAKRRKSQRIRVRKHRASNVVRNALQPQARNALLRDGTGRVGKGDSSLASGGEEISEGDAFLAFYGAYPRHEGKADAEKAFRHVVGTRPPQARLLEIVAAQCANNFAGRAKQHIPLPGSWLRGARWDDEITPPVAPGGSHGGASAARTRTSEDSGKWDREAARNPRVVAIGAPAARGEPVDVEAGGDSAPAGAREAAR